MLAKMIKIDEKSGKNQLKAAAEALKNGALVAFPTETVYGLGANALLKSSVKKIYEAKGRPSDNPLIVHISEKNHIYKLCKDVPPIAERIMDKLCPGPITMVLYKSDIVPDEVTAGGKTVAVRIPQSELARELISLSGVPVAAPSANISGKPSPTCANHVYDDLKDKVEYIIDGGECRVGLESTVIDLTVVPPRILRPGGVSYEELKELLGEVQGYAPEESDETAPKSPGMKYKHYAPKAQMVVFEGESCRAEIKKALCGTENKKVCIITAGEQGYGDIFSINCGETAEEYSKNLFASLRRADSVDAEVIFAEFPFKTGGIATALRNRIYKSCGGNVVLCK